MNEREAQRIGRRQARRDGPDDKVGGGWWLEMKDGDGERRGREKRREELLHLCCTTPAGASLERRGVANLLMSALLMSALT